MSSLRKKITIISATMIMITAFQGLALAMAAPEWLVKFSTPLGALMIFLCGLVIGQEWAEMEKGFFAVLRVVLYGIVLGMLFSYLPVFFGVYFDYNQLIMFLLGRGAMALLMWTALGIAGVFTGSLIQSV